MWCGLNAICTQQLVPKSWRHRTAHSLCTHTALSTTITTASTSIFSQRQRQTHKGTLQCIFFQHCVPVLLPKFVYIYIYRMCVRYSVTDCATYVSNEIKCEYLSQRNIGKRKFYLHSSIANISKFIHSNIAKSRSFYLICS